MPAETSLWHVRPFTPSDLEQTLWLWDKWTVDELRPSLSVADLVQALSDGVPAVVAEFEGSLVGAAFARISGKRAWIQRLVIAEPWRGRGIGRSMLALLESRVHELGIDRMVAILPPTSTELFRQSGWKITGDVSFAEKDSGQVGAQERMLAALGAQRRPDALWAGATGDTAAGRVAERRIVSPLKHPELAGSVGLRVPRALLLFGPPGTGKTTFVHALAARLNRPVVEWQRPASGQSRPAQDMAAFFNSVAQLNDVVLFLDEAEEFASKRVLGSSPDAAACTNELLKAIGRIDLCQQQLLIAATNHIDTLDPAILRPGRFDLVLPVGPPDAFGRELILQGRLAGCRHAVDDLSEVVEATAGYTSADLTHVMDLASQAAFEEALSGGEALLTTSHLRRAVSATPPSLSDDELRRFEEQRERYTRE